MTQIVRTQKLVPILSDLAYGYLNSTSGPVRSRLTLQEQKDNANRPWALRTSYVPAYDSEVLRYCAEGYGVTEEEFRSCVAYCKQPRQYPCCLDHPVLTRCIVVDDL